MQRAIDRTGTENAALIIATLAGCAETQPQVRAAPPVHWLARTLSASGSA
jgi:hypothetical protein